MSQLPILSHGCLYLLLWPFNIGDKERRLAWKAALMVAVAFGIAHLSPAILLDQTPPAIEVRTSQAALILTYSEPIRQTVLALGQWMLGALLVSLLFLQPTGASQLLRYLVAFLALGAYLAFGTSLVLLLLNIVLLCLERTVIGIAALIAAMGLLVLFVRLHQRRIFRYQWLIPKGHGGMSENFTLGAVITLYAVYMLSK